MIAPPDPYRPYARQTDLFHPSRVSPSAKDYDHHVMAPSPLLQYLSAAFEASTRLAESGMD
jgi:hypothetical protein